MYTINCYFFEWIFANPFRLQIMPHVISDVCRYNSRLEERNLIFSLKSKSLSRYYEISFSLCHLHSYQQPMNALVFPNHFLTKQKKNKPPDISCLVEVSRFVSIIFSLNYVIVKFSNTQKH